MISPENESTAHPDKTDLEMEQALRFLNSGDFIEARIEIERLLREQPDDPRLITLLGNTYFESDEDIEKAEECYRQALQFDPDNILALANMGMLSIRQKRFDEAVEYARRAILKHPRDPRSCITL